MLTTSDFARELGVKSETVGRWIRQGRLYAQKTQGEWFIPPEAAKAFQRGYVKRSPAAPGTNNPPGQRITIRPRRRTRAIKGQGLSLRMAPEDLALLDAERRRRPDHPSRGALITELIRKGLT